jgi:hypothetical protein
MQEGQSRRVQRLATELDRWTIEVVVDIPLLADERVPAQSGLDANLVALAGDQADLDE